MSQEKGKLLQCHPLQQRVEISALSNFGHSGEAVSLVTTCINWERACVEVEEGSCSEEVRATRLTFVYAQESEYTSGCSATPHCGYRSHKLSGGREEGGGSLFMTAG